MKQSYKARLVSEEGCPLLMHNGQTANPLNHFTKALRQISSKRTKTDADFEQMAKIEWHAGLYLASGRPCIPGVVLEATLINAAKKSKKGMQAKAGMYVTGDFVLEYDGPASIDELWEDERFRFISNVRVQRNTVVRTRPKFDSWQTDVEIAFNDEMLNATDIKQFLLVAGRDVGLMDWRPRYGRFEVLS